MLSSSSLGMTNNSGLLCSNTVSTVARQDFERATSSTETLPGTARPSRKAQAASWTVRETARVVEPGVMASQQCLSTIRKKIFKFFDSLRFFFFHHDSFIFLSLTSSSHFEVSMLFPGIGEDATTTSTMATTTTATMATQFQPNVV